MIRAIEIQNKLLNLIGWEQNYDATGLQISEALTHSDTGLYYQQAHPLLTIQNLTCIAPDFKNIQSNEANERFSNWLESKTKASIIKAVTRFINDKTIKGAGKILLENRTLFDVTGRISDTVKNRNNIVGFEIVPVRSNGVTTKINRICLHFTEPGNYKVYIFHSSSSEPIYTIELEKTKRNAAEWFNVNDIYLPYRGPKTDIGGSWYLCYEQSALPENSKAIQKEYDWSKGPCKSCSKREYDAWQLWSKYVEIHPFYTPNPNIRFSNDFNNDFSKPTLQMWDVENNNYTYDNNYGINIELSVGCDITDFIVEQKEIFADVIMKQLAIDMLREFAYNANVRTNRHSINASRLDILYEIDGDSSSLKKSGLSYQLEQAYKAIDFTTRGLDRICMPCVNNGIKYRTV